IGEIEVSETDDPVRELKALLAQIKATPVAAKREVAASILYDSDYHFALVACAFAMHAKPDSKGRKQILAPWLKLLQFVAARPRLLADVRDWAGGRLSPDLETWSKMPRGFILDRTHDGIIDFLVAAG